MHFASINGPYGIQPASIQTRCVNKAAVALAVGDVVVTSFVHAGVVTDPSEAGSPDYVFNTVRLADGDETGNSGFIGVVSSLTAQGGGVDKVINVQFGGIINAAVSIVSGGTVLAGTPLGVTNTGGKFTNSGANTDATAVAAVLMQDATAATTVARVFVPLQYWTSSQI